MSAYAIARSQLDAARAAARQDGVDEELLLRALLASVAEAYRDLRGPGDLRSVLQFQLDNAEGDEDYAFMRP